MSDADAVEDDDHWRERAAKLAFNRCWEFVDETDRSPEDDRQMLLAACASRYLWESIGGDEQRAVGDWQVAHAASLLGDGTLALTFAASSLAIVEANGWTDWRLASAYEGMARAHAVAGDAVASKDYRGRCETALRGLDDDDRKVIGAQLKTIPKVR